MWRLHVDALGPYVEKTWGWDDALQRRFVDEVLSAGAGQIVVIDGTDAGVWHVAEHDSYTFLISIRLLPEFQNRGIGTRLITDLLNNADKPVHLQVLKVNPARVLYERLGFQVSGETETHYKMINEGDPRLAQASDRSDTKY